MQALLIRFIPAQRDDCWISGASRVEERRAAGKKQKQLGAIKKDAIDAACFSVLNLLLNIWFALFINAKILW